MDGKPSRLAAGFFRFARPPRPASGMVTSYPNSQASAIQAKPVSFPLRTCGGRGDLRRSAGVITCGGLRRLVPIREAAFAKEFTSTATAGVRRRPLRGSSPLIYAYSAITFCPS